MTVKFERPVYIAGVAETPLGEVHDQSEMSMLALAARSLPESCYPAPQRPSQNWLLQRVRFRYPASGASARNASPPRPGSAALGLSPAPG